MAYFRYANKLKKNENPDWIVYWDYTKSVPDQYGNISPTINNTPYSKASYLSSNGATIDSNGVHIIGDNGVLKPNSSPLLYTNETMEIKFGEVSKAFSTDVHGRLIMFTNQDGFVFRKQTQKWQMYASTNGNIGWLDNDIAWDGESDPNIFSNKTLKIVYDKNKKLHFYLNNKLIWENNEMKPVYSENYLRIEIGCSSQSYFNTTIKSLGLYETPSESLILLHFEDDFVNNQITDAKGNTFTRSTNTVELSNNYKFGEHSLAKDGGDYLYLPKTENSLDLGNNDFTIDFWVYPKRRYYREALIIVNGVYIDMYDCRPRMWWVADGYWIIHADSSAGGGDGTITMPLNTWSHIALVRHGDYFTLFVNGAKSVEANIGSISMHIYDQLNWSMILGIWDDTAGFGYYGNYDEVRITDKAVWTEEFTPPTRPYTK